MAGGLRTRSPRVRATRGPAAPGWATPALVAALTTAGAVALLVGASDFLVSRLVAGIALSVALVAAVVAAQRARRH